MLFLVALLAACGSSAANLVRYDRSWPDGYHEDLTVMADGHVSMHHGQYLERLTLTAAQVQRIKDALAAGVPKGDKGDSLVRTVDLADGTTVSPVNPIPGSAVDLLEVLLTTHSLDGAAVQGASPAPAHVVPSPGSS